MTTLICRANQQSPAKQQSSTPVPRDVTGSLSDSPLPTDHIHTIFLKHYSFDDDEDNNDVRSPSLSSGSRDRASAGRLSAAPTLPSDEKLRDKEDVFGSVVSLKEDIP